MVWEIRVSETAKKQLGKLDTRVKGQMPPVNQLLQRLKLEPIRAEALKVEGQKAGGQ